MAITLDGTGGITPPQWTTSTRPPNPTYAQVGFNTTMNVFEWYDTKSSSWITLGSPLVSVANSSGGSVTPNSNTTTQLNLTGLTANVSILPPTGTPYDGQRLLFKIKDDGLGERTLTWTTTGTGSYRQVGVVIPTKTYLGKTSYVGTLYNSEDTRWDVVAVSIES
jgi:hypothetical protein